jgi:hypothetical protein
LSNQQTVSEIVEVREAAFRTNQSLITLTHIAADGRVALRDFVTLARVLTGGQESLQAVITYAQTTIAVVGAARTALKLLEIEMGPVGWALLGISVFAGVVGMDQLARRPRY